MFAAWKGEDARRLVLGRRHVATRPVEQHLMLVPEDEAEAGLVLDPDGAGLERETPRLHDPGGPQHVRRGTPEEQDGVLVGDLGDRQALDLELSDLLVGQRRIMLIGGALKALVAVGFEAPRRIGEDERERPDDSLHGRACRLCMNRLMPALAAFLGPKRARDAQ